MRKGIKPSTHSVNQQGELMENSSVIKDIEKTLNQEFCCYGYRNMTAELREIGWLINHKKVYRLMKESKLVCQKIRHIKGRHTLQLQDHSCLFTLMNYSLGYGRKLIFGQYKLK